MDGSVTQITLILATKQSTSNNLYSQPTSFAVEKLSPGRNLESQQYFCNHESGFWQQKRLSVLASWKNEN